jgi:hypothetical protein
VNSGMAAAALLGLAVTAGLLLARRGQIHG